MRNKTLFLCPNPEFDKRKHNGISKLYRIFCLEFGYNLEIIDLDFLSTFIPEDDYSQTLIIAGGDGTIHRAINTIPDEAFKKYVFGIIPSGTANEFAKGLSIPLSMYESACMIAQPKKIYYQHLGIINEEYKFATGIMYGIANKILQYTPTIAKHYLGMAGFQFGFLRLYAESFRPWAGFIKKFKIDSKEFRTNYLLINNTTLKSKDLGPEDIDGEDRNMFSLIYIHSRLKPRDIIRVMLKHHMHYRILYDPALNYEQLAEINLQFENDLEFMLDGDMYIFSSPLKIKLFDKPMAVISG
ncbi:MAG: Diacylglycerol kinase catalytic region [uncultured bacterium]|nr:MAG: Diacylglycerol kinase catalytic region [uncultured bacterium]HBH17880.1 hypothetical protein [Cyanobacteria bacterium UBA9579]